MNNALIVLIYLTAILLDIRSRKGKLCPAIRSGVPLDERELSRYLCSGVIYVGWNDELPFLSRVEQTLLTTVFRAFAKKARRTRINRGIAIGSGSSASRVVYPYSARLPGIARSEQQRFLMVVMAVFPYLDRGHSRKSFHESHGMALSVSPAGDPIKLLSILYLLLPARSTSTEIVVRAM